MNKELKELFNERQILREAILQLSESLSNEWVAEMTERLKKVQQEIEDIIYDWK